MHRLLLLPVLTIALQAGAAQDDRYDYFEANREMIARGVQALLTCNGLFTSERTLEQVFRQELAYLEEPLGTAAGGDYTVDRDLKSVAIGTPDNPPMMRAAFRQGVGCVIMAPDQDRDDIDSLPRLALAPAPGDPAEIPWPNGDLVEVYEPAAGVDAAALEAAADWAFERESPEQVTVSLLVVHDGDIALERYAPGIDVTTRTRTPPPRVSR